MDGGELIAEAGRGLKLLGGGCGHHARGEGALEFGLAALKK